jgi:hypothetical protein
MDAFRWNHDPAKNEQIFWSAGFNFTSLSPPHEGDTYFEPLFHEKLKNLPAIFKAKILVRPLCLALSYMLLYLVDQSISCFLQGDGETYCQEKSEG